MYDEFYHFSGKPFQLTPDRKFYFNSRSHHRAMAYLRYGLEQSEGFIVITGAVGTGKTMLVQNLFSELKNRDILGAELVTTQIEPEDVLRMVCASFGLAHQGQNKATMLRNLEVLARARHAEGKRVLLVVDEAQNLPAMSVEELRMLSNFQIDGRALFQTFLLGQDEFKKTLQAQGMDQVRQRIIASYHLDPLSEEETRKYIEHRLQMVGWKNDPQIDADVYQWIFNFTKGIPRRINSLCDRLLLFSCLEEKHRIDLPTLDAVVDEIQQETGLSSDVFLDPEEFPSHRSGESAPSARTEQRPQGDSAPLGAEASAAVERLTQRLASLEQEIENLKKTAQRERRLLRQALLLQLEAENDIENH